PRGRAGAAGARSASRSNDPAASGRCRAGRENFVSGNPGFWILIFAEILRGSNGKHCPLCGGLMGHATLGRTGPARAKPSTGHAAPAGGSADVRRRAAGAGVSEFGMAVVADLSARRAARPAAHADPRATAAVVWRPTAHAGAHPDTGAAPRGLPHRS